MSKFKRNYKFNYSTGDVVVFGDLSGIITYIDNESEYGVEAEFINEKGEKEICYFNKEGKHKGQESTSVLKFDPNAKPFYMEKFK